MRKNIVKKMLILGIVLTMGVELAQCSNQKEVQVEKTEENSASFLVQKDSKELSNEFFEGEKIADNIIKIKGLTYEFMYLVEGKDKAALIDTGTGIGNLKEYVEKLTDKPIEVILTHGHVDHSSGAANFDNVYMNHLDDEVYKENNKLQVRKDYAKGQCREFDKIKESDYVQEKPCDGFKELKDGDEFDLGGTTLVAYNAYGHTPGEMAILFKEQKLLLTGDAANPFTFLFNKETLDIPSYEESMKSLLAKTDGKFDKILLSHGLTEVPKELLGNIIDLCEDIKSGNVDDVPMESLGKDVYLAKKTNEKMERDDGKVGNIVYSKNRVK